MNLETDPQEAALQDFVSTASAEAITERSKNGPNALTAFDEFFADEAGATELATEIEAYLKQKYEYTAPNPEQILVALRQIRDGIQYVRVHYGTTPLGFFVAEELALKDGQISENPGYVQQSKSVVIPYSFLRYAGAAQSPRILTQYRQKPGQYISGKYFYLQAGIEEAAHCHQDLEGRFVFPEGKVRSDMDDLSEQEIDTYMEKAAKDLEIPLLTTPDNNVIHRSANWFTLVRDVDKVEVIT